jgi:hypothetical protein
MKYFRTGITVFLSVERNRVDEGRESLKIGGAGIICGFVRKVRWFIKKSNDMMNRGDLFDFIIIVYFSRGLNNE